MEATKKQLMVIYFIARELEYYSQSRDITSPSNVTSLRSAMDNDKMTENLPENTKDEIEKVLRDTWSLILKIK